MKSIFRKIYNFKMIVSLVWLVFTFSIVAWWALIGLGIHTIRTPEEIERHQRMILWEGGALLLAILVGGFFLISYVYRDMDRHEKMKIFFANFSHDIKTSLSRLKLQAEVLTEQLSESPQIEKKSIDRFMLDLSRLELQLENSLMMSHLENSVLLEEQLMIKDLVESLSVEFESLKISLNKNAQIYADSRALRSILRNIFENSIRHGKATAMSIELKSSNQGQVIIALNDNGQGTKLDSTKLGLNIVPFKQSSSNGIGLYLAKKLIVKMHGKITFKSDAGHGFTTEIVLNGILI